MYHNVSHIEYLCLSADWESIQIDLIYIYGTHIIFMTRNMLSYFAFDSGLVILLNIFHSESQLTTLLDQLRNGKCFDPENPPPLPRCPFQSHTVIHLCAT